MAAVNDAFDTNSLSSFSDPESDSLSESLSFFSKISHQLKTHFSRNEGNEDFCDHIYDDTYSPPTSGRFSYYTDLLAMAQLKNGTTANAVSSSTKRFSRAASSTPQVSKSFCPWQCSGYQDPSLGSGPLEDLFNVLDPTHPNFVPHPSTMKNANDSSWQDLNGEIFSADSFENGFLDFVDILHRWSSSDAFPLDFQGSDALDA